MGYAIELNFDNKTSNQLKKLWMSLKYHKICDFMAEHGSKPHIALLVFEEEATIEKALVALVEKFFNNYEAIDIPLNSLGVFQSEANIVYINPIVTSQLLKCQQELYNVVCEAGFGDYIIKLYKPGNWAPHVTMTMNSKETDMVDAIKLLKRKFKPMTAKTVSVALLSFYPVSYKTTVELKVKA